MIDFSSIVVNDIIDYKSKEGMCNEYLQYIDLDSTIKSTFQLVVDNIVREYNSKIITDLYLNNTDTYSLVPISHARVRREYLKVKKGDIEKYKSDYENHGPLLNHNLVNCLIAIFSEVGGCSVERIPSRYSPQGCIIYDQMEGIKLTIARRNYYSEETVNEHYRDSPASVVKREMLINTLDSLDLGIADITPYLKIEYPTPYVMDDMSINRDIALKIGSYRLKSEAQHLIDTSPSIKRDVDEAHQLKMQQELDTALADDFGDFGDY